MSATPIITPLAVSVAAPFQQGQAGVIAITEAQVGEVLAARLINVSTAGQLLALLGDTPIALNFPKNSAGQTVLPEGVKAALDSGQPLLLKVLAGGAQPQLAFVGVGRDVMASRATSSLQALSSIPLEQTLLQGEGLKAAQHQAGLAPLLAQLSQMINADTQHATPALREALSALAKLPLDAQSPITSQKIRDVVALSGIFHESGTTSAAQAGRHSTPLPDLKGLLVQIKAELKNLSVSLAPNLAPTVAPSLATPQNIADQEQSASLTKANGNEITSRPSPPPLKGGPLPLEPLASFEKAPPLTQEGVSKLVQQIEAGVERIKLMQLASLPETFGREPRTSQSDAPPSPRNYTLEVPLRTEQGMAMMGVRIEEEREKSSSHTSSLGEKETQSKAWSVRLALNIEPLGALEARIHVQLKEGDAPRVGVHVWAERSDVARSFQGALPQLRTTLRDADFDVCDLHINVGRAPQIAKSNLSSQAAHFVDMTR
jgi:hypothetical protein